MEELDAILAELDKRAFAVGVSPVAREAVIVVSRAGQTHNDPALRDQARQLMIKLTDEAEANPPSLGSYIG